MDDSLNKLNKYCESQVQKKQIRNEILTERPVGPNILKKGSQVHRNSSDVVNQRLEDRAKNNVLNKRVRTSVADLRVWKFYPFTSILVFNMRLFIHLSFHIMKNVDVHISVLFSF